MKYRAARFAILLGTVALLFGCSAKEHAAVLPTNPAPAPLPPVTRGAMVARLNGDAWQSTRTVTAVLGNYGGPSFFVIDGVGADAGIDLSMPATVHTGSTCTFGMSEICHAGVSIPGTRDGYTTLVSPYVGTVTITAIDSSHIAGEFQFDALGTPGGMMHVTEGEFDAVRNPFLEGSRAGSTIAARRPTR